jgi:hypothetical protein
MAGDGGEPLLERTARGDRPRQSPDHRESLLEHRQKLQIHGSNGLLKFAIEHKSQLA